MEVLFGTPTYDKTLSVDYVHSIIPTIQELTRQGVNAQWFALAGNCFVDRARNAIVDHFLKSTCTDLIFVDADVGWDWQAVTRILSHDVDIVGGLVPKRAADNEAEFHSNALTGRIVNGLFETKELPTAFMRIRRNVFKEIDKAYPSLKGSDLACPHTPYFQSKIVDGHGFNGEDIFFCRRWDAMCKSIWIDADISFSHRGDKVWRGNFYDHAVNSGIIKKG